MAVQMVKTKPRGWVNVPARRSNRHHVTFDLQDSVKYLKHIIGEIKTQIILEDQKTYLSFVTQICFLKDKCEIYSFSS